MPRKIHPQLGAEVSKPTKKTDPPLRQLALVLQELLQGGLGEVPRSLPDQRVLPSGTSNIH